MSEPLLPRIWWADPKDAPSHVCGLNFVYGAQRTEAAIVKAKVSVCSVLRDRVKGQTTAVECEVMSFETAFMPHTLPKDGRRVIDAAQAANLLPTPEESNVVQITQHR